MYLPREPENLLSIFGHIKNLRSNQSHTIVS